MQKLAGPHSSEWPLQRVKGIRVEAFVVTPFLPGAISARLAFVMAGMASFPTPTWR